jgi:hypothetical protein
VLARLRASPGHEGDLRIFCAFPCEAKGLVQALSLGEHGGPRLSTRLVSMLLSGASVGGGMDSQRVTLQVRRAVDALQEAVPQLPNVCVAFHTVAGFFKPAEGSVLSILLCLGCVLSLHLPDGLLLWHRHLVLVLLVVLSEPRRCRLLFPDL